MMQELVQQIKNLTSDMIGQIHTALPGKIVKFDANKCLAIVQPIGKFKKPDGALLDLPQISNVPIVFMQSAGQKATIAYPIEESDGCLLLFAEQALDYWRLGSNGEMKADLKHDLTNCIAVPGLFAKANAVMREACNKRSVIIQCNGNYIAVSEAGITVRGDITVDGSIKVSGGISAGVGGLSESGVLTVKTAEVENSLNVKKVSAQEVDVSGNLTAGGVNMNKHKHTSSTSGSDTSGPH